MKLNPDEINEIHENLARIERRITRITHSETRSDLAYMANAIRRLLDGKWESKEATYE